jgi:type VI secretion system lysozyme-like protein
MAPTFSRPRITQSLFDRLTDREPLSKSDLAATSLEQMKTMKDGVARDLTNLLNVRRSDADIPEEYAETNSSVAAYGLRDLSSAPIQPNQIGRAIEKVVKVFEPRLSQITVLVVKQSHHRLEFRISAVLQTDLHNEPVLFDAALPMDSRRFQVTEGR